MSTTKTLARLRDEVLSDTREDILLEIEVITANLAAQVMDTDSADDRTPDPLGDLRRVERLEKRIKAFDKYGVDRMTDLKADPVFRRDNLLYRAVHGMQNASVRWSARRATGLTDVELVEAFNSEAGGGYSGYTGDEGWYDCRPGKFAWKGRDSEQHLLTGSALAKALRDILPMPYPAGKDNVPLEQLNLFAEP